MVSRQELKRYFWFIFGIAGVVFFWAGIWDGLGNISYLQNPWISLAVGIFLLSISKLIFRDADPFWGSGKAEVQTVLEKIDKHPKKHEFNIKYKDKLKNKEVTIKANKFKEIEKEFIVFLEKGKEIFVPLHRVTEVAHKNKTHWKK